MKVLFNTYPTAFVTPGGGEIQLLQYKKNLSNEYINADLYNQWDPDLRDCDILHFFSCMPGSEYFFHFIKLLGIRIFISPNLWITQESKSDYPFDSIKSQLKYADRIVCNSDVECKTLSEVFDIPIDRFLRIYNGVEDIFFEPAPPNLFKDSHCLNQKFILNVANIEPRKNQLNLVRAMKNFPQYKLVIMGNIRDQKYANQVISEGGAQLILVGSQPHGSEMQRSAYASCDLFILPSLLETPGLAALEAAASGASIVITSEGSTREYFQDFVTYIDPYSLSSIEEGIRLSLKAPPSNLVDEIRKNFTWSKALEPLVRCYLNGDVFGSKAKAVGFHFSERDDESLFAWGKKHFSIETSASRMSFQWRSPNNSKVDIYINGDLYKRNIEVTERWENFSLDIADKNADDFRVFEFNVSTKESLTNGDSRDLGVAIRYFELG